MFSGVHFIILMNSRGGVVDDALKGAAKNGRHCIPRVPQKLRYPASALGVVLPVPEKLNKGFHVILFDVHVRDQM